MKKLNVGLGQIHNCQVCESKSLEPLLDFGNQPIVQSYLSLSKIQEPEVTYPLKLVRCAKCCLLQIDFIVDPQLVFPAEYPYRTGLTNMLVRNFEELAESMMTNEVCKPGDLVVDIGSNDGSLLSSFRSRGMRVVGIEPTNAADVACANKIDTYKEYFSAKSVKKVKEKYGKAKIISATNVFAHISDTKLLIKNIKQLMDHDSVFISESQYLGDIFEKREFDTIYHEHLRYYSLKPLITLAADAGMSVTDAHRITSAGGSIRVFMKKGNHKPSKSVTQIISHEKNLGLYNTKLLKEFADQIIKVKHDLLALLLEIKKHGVTIAGISSSARSNTLLGFANISNYLISYIGEKQGSPKIGLYTPGTHIPVVDEKVIFKNQPEYALVLSWHIGEELMRLYRKRGYRGKFILPLPSPRVVNDI